jgi:hypothetical protein
MNSVFLCNEEYDKYSDHTCALSGAMPNTNKVVLLSESEVVSGSMVMHYRNMNEGCSICGEILTFHLPASVCLAS